MTNCENNKQIIPVQMHRHIICHSIIVFTVFVEKNVILKEGANVVNIQLESSKTSGS